MKKPIVVYHGQGCLDGLAGAWCFHNFFGASMEYLPGIYQAKVNVEEFRDRDVYLVDFSYPHDVVASILEVASSVVLLDHHATTIDDLWDLVPKGLNMDYATVNHSGARIAWDYIALYTQHGQPRPKLIDHIEDRDMWTFAIEDTAEVNAALYSYRRDFELLDKWMHASSYGLKKLIAEGRTLLRAQARNVEAIIQGNTRSVAFTSAGEVPFVNASYMFASDIGNALAEFHPFVVVYQDTKLHREFSLRSARSNPNHADVGAIAKSFGGGGHKHAAGFKVLLTDPIARL